MTEATEKQFLLYYPWLTADEFESRFDRGSRGVNAGNLRLHSFLGRPSGVVIQRLQSLRGDELGPTRRHARPLSPASPKCCVEGGFPRLDPF